MSLLLFSDPHLDENPDNEYRFGLFDHIVRILEERSGITGVFCLGDFLDRRDRFSGKFVNRLLDQMQRVAGLAPFWIMKGNHDDPLSGPAFFEFVNDRIDGIRYVTRPTPCGRVILLPFTRDPHSDWQGIDFSKFRAAFLHVTPNGAISESGYQLTGRQLPEFPKGVRLYTGDVHQPQKLRRWTIVGCPHPIKFGDEFQPRMLLLDEGTLEVEEEIPIRTIGKRVVEISGVGDLERVEVRPGDQVRVRVSLSGTDVDRLGEIERAVAAFAASAGVTIASTETVVETPTVQGAADRDMPPDEVLRQFAAEDDISLDLLDLGVELMREAMQ